MFVCPTGASQISRPPKCSINELMSNDNSDQVTYVVKKNLVDYVASLAEKKRYGKR